MRDERGDGAAPDKDGPGDSGELEFSSLRPERSNQSRSAAAWPLLGWMRRKLLAWRRPLGAGMALLMVAALTGGVLFSAYQKVIIPAPAPLAFSERAVYFEYGADWGNILLNGQKVDVQSLLQGEEPMILQRGTSRIDFSAPPYPPVHCVISAPPARTDTCPLLHDLTMNDPISSPDQGRLVNLGDLISRLPSGQFNALVGATEDALATLTKQGINGAFYSSVTLAAGDHYLDAQGNVTTALTPMKATLSFSLQRSGHRYAVSGRFPCKIFCDVWPNPEIDAWITAGYTYTPLDGSGAASRGALFPATAGVDNSFLLPLRISWANGWRVSVSQYDAMGTTDQFCGIGSVLATQEMTNGSAASPQQYGVGDALGCAYTVAAASQQIQQGASSAGMSDSQAILLFRCGAMIAVNALAQQVAPTLPLASPTEAQAAQQLIGGQS